MENIFLAKSIKIKNSCEPRYRQGSAMSRKEEHTEVHLAPNIQTVVSQSSIKNQSFNH